MSINFLAVLAAAFSSFVLGGLSYSRYGLMLGDWH